MSKLIKSKRRPLVQALLMSTLMVAPNAQAILLPFNVTGLNIGGILNLLITPPLNLSILDSLLYNDILNINTAGQLAGTTNLVDASDLRIIQITANNNNASANPTAALLASGSGNGIHLGSGANSSTVTVGSGSNIVSTGSGAGILIDSLVTGIGVTNSGGIKSATGSAINNSGAISTFVNNATGTITSSGASALNLLSGSSLPAFNNQGTISTTSLTSTVNAINSLGNITGALTNSGSITASAGSALALLGSTVALPSISNSGTISSLGTGSGIDSHIPITGNITNTSTGSITSTAGSALNLAAGSLGGIANTGTISSQGTAAAIISAIPIGGDIVNNSLGLITASNAPALNLNSGSSIVNLTNIGTISTTSNTATINAINSLGNITGTINNSGLIKANSGTALALLASTVALPSITNSGTISSSNTGSGIESHIPITGALTNTSTGSITSTAGTALNLVAGSLGSISNSGTISSNGTAAAIISDIPIAGDIVNNASGSITSVGGSGLSLANTSSVVNLNNLGIISTASNTPTVNAVNSLGNITGNITNGGSITAASGNALALLGSTLPVNSITNSGTMQSSGAGSGILSKVAITGNITNDATKLINSASGTALDLDSGSLGGSVLNSGMISSGGAAAALVSDIPIAGDIVNQATGTITSTGGSGLSLGSTSSLTNLTNAGIISTTSNTPTVNAINSLGNITGIINNSGSVTAPSGTALALLDSTAPLSSITNSGTISSGNAGSGIESHIPITGVLTNTGTGSITSTAGTAVNLLEGSLGGINNTGMISNNGSVAAIVSDIPIAGDIINNALGTITSTGGSGLSLGNTSSLVNLTNAGIISTTSNTPTVNAINSLGNITGIINNSGSVTAPSGTALALLDSTAPLSSITNSGTISSGNAGSGIESHIPITGVLTNTSTGSITSTAGTAVNLLEGSLGGVNNSGIISNNGPTAAIVSDIPVGSIINTATGTITSTGGPGLGLESTSSLVNLTNAGIISTTSNTPTVNAINSVGNITGAITNSGSITAPAGNAVALLASSLPVGSITNNGTISSAGAGSGILSNVPITGNITNNAGNAISSASGTAINLSGGSLGGIINNGIIESSGAGSAIASSIPIAGSLTNNTLGLINSANGNALDLASGSSLGNLTNAGTISTDSLTNTISAINLAGNMTGGIANTGLISAAAGPAIDLVSAVVNGSLNNSGVIASLGSQPAIVLDQLSNIKGGIINSGTITSALGTVAADLSASQNSVAFINNLNGVVTGDLKLSQVANNLDPVFQITNGSILGNVIAAGGTGASTLSVIAGNVNGIVLSSNRADVINQVGGQVGAITGTSNANQVLNILGIVNNNGPISNIDNILVGSNAQLTVNNILSGLKTVTLKQNPINLPNIINNSNFIMDPGSTLEVELGNINTFGHMLLNGAVNTLNNANLKVTLAPGSLINNGDEFEILKSLISPITGQVNLILPSASLTLSIKDSINGLLDFPSLILIVSRLYQSPLNIPELGNILSDLLNSLGIGLAINPDLLGFTSALDQLTTGEAVTNGLSSLAPPANGGLPDLAQRTFRKVLDGVFDHLYFADCCPVTKCRDHECYPAGLWTRVMGDYATRKGDDVYGGYHLKGGSVIVGYDACSNEHSTVGGALSFSAGDVNTDLPAYQRQKLWSYQLTGYLTHDYGCCFPLYVDVMAAVAFDTFNSRREIVAGSYYGATRADYEGWHYGADVESGYRFIFGNCQQYQFIPLVRLRYSNLDINDYSEVGNGLALQVESNNVGEFVTGAGVKFRRTTKRLIPELRMNVYYDWIADPQDSTASFLLGGDPFIVTGRDVDALMYNVGVSLGGEIRRNLILALSYDADFKSSYFGQTAAIKFKYEW